MADKIATRAAYGEFLVEEGARNPDLIVMDADLSGSTKTKDFAKKYPDRFFNAGIAEQNLMGMATGIALSGKTVCASTFAMFASGRAFEIIRNSIGYTGANVKVCATHAGITVGEDGASHQTFEDLALMRTIPGMTVVSPCDAASAKILLKQVVDMKGPAYVRLGRAGVPVFYDGDAELTLGKGNQLREGRDVTVIANGIMVASAMDAASQLAEEGIDVRAVVDVDVQVHVQTRERRPADFVVDGVTEVGELRESVELVVGGERCVLQIVFQVGGAEHVGASAYLEIVEQSCHRTIEVDVGLAVDLGAAGLLRVYEQQVGAAHLYVEPHGVEVAEVKGALDVERLVVVGKDLEVLKEQFAVLERHGV